MATLLFGRGGFAQTGKLITKRYDTGRCIVSVILRW